ncbi:hypothetical protein NDU88_004359 [Pleurodeles waltl]|uniref:Uncharacterized protein n=1 Tax=Pleurodeles waltl TaxID=8319 RepID=A0AAV7W9H7_PLEWA|nr:hypothetical protein NDU88_004359 [Pleurodeles waltl]
MCPRGSTPHPVATVHLNWKGEDGIITVGVIPNLGEDLILGTDYVNFTSLLDKAGQEQVNSAWWEEAPFGASEEENRKPRIKLSRKQKREQRREYRNFRDLKNLDPTTSPAVICTIKGDFRQCQHEDPTLKHAWHQALHPDGHVTQKEEPGSGNMNLRGRENPAFMGGEARYNEAEGSGSDRTQREDAEKGEGTDISAAREANRGTPATLLEKSGTPDPRPRVLAAVQPTRETKWRPRLNAPGWAETGPAAPLEVIAAVRGSSEDPWGIWARAPARPRPGEKEPDEPGERGGPVVPVCGRRPGRPWRPPTLWGEPADLN